MDTLNSFRHLRAHSDSFSFCLFTVNIYITKAVGTLITAVMATSCLMHSKTLFSESCFNLVKVNLNVLT